MSYTINFSKQMSGILHPNPNMLKSTKEKIGETVRAGQ